MSEPTNEAPAAPPPYEDVTTAPYVYFDAVAAHGVMNGAIQIEVAARHLEAIPAGGVIVKFATSARLRCSPAAANALRESLEATLKMLEQPQPAPAAASSTLN